MIQSNVNPMCHRFIPHPRLILSKLSFRLRKRMRYMNVTMAKSSFFTCPNCDDLANMGFDILVPQISVVMLLNCQLGEGCREHYCLH